jgi:hypothetical protein
MTKEFVTNWISKLPEAEKDLPLLLLNGIVYTPRVAVQEILRGSPVGTQLQHLIESGSFGTTYTDEQTIAKLRLTEIMRTKPEKPLFATLSGKVFTPSELLKEIQEGTSIGSQWVNNEVSHMKALMQVR